MKSHAKVEKRQIIFTSPMSRDMFLAKAEGKEITLELDESPTDEMRGFFHGAVVPAFFYLHPEVFDWKTFKDAREAIKLEYRPAWLTTKDRERKKYGQSMENISKKQMTILVNQVVKYLQENFDVQLDAKDYKKWKNSAPARGEVYPPTLRMKEKWERVRSLSTEAVLTELEGRHKM